MDASTPSAGAYRFSGFTLDLTRGALLGADGVAIPLRPKSFALLRLLVEQAGRLLDRDTIMAAVWPDVVVGDESITQCVRDIRKALGDEAQALLQTVPKRGYLLAAEATALAPPPSATVMPRLERRLHELEAAGDVSCAEYLEAHAKHDALNDPEADARAKKMLRQAKMQNALLAFAPTRALLNLLRAVPELVWWPAKIAAISRPVISFASSFCPLA